MDQEVLPDRSFVSGRVDTGTKVRVVPRRVRGREESGVREPHIGDEEFASDETQNHPLR